MQKNKVIHVILMEAIRAAALLHDIGHPPFSHIVEFALKAVFIEKKDNLENNRVQNFIDTMSPYFESKNKLHEQMGNEISESILKEGHTYDQVSRNPSAKKLVQYKINS